MPHSNTSQHPTLLDDVRRVLRLHHSSMHTERAYLGWIVRCIRFHRMRRREALLPGEPKIETFLSHLAMAQTVTPATQNQALNALIFLYKRVLTQATDGSINAVRADKQVNVPVVMTREEVATVLSLLEGPPQRVGKLLYGSG